MKVILKQDIDTLGKAGDVINVSDGHARNYLIPKGLAAEATDRNVTRLAQEKKHILQQIAKEKQKAEDLIGRLSQIVCEIPRRVGEQEKLFGSVSTKDIEAALQDRGFAIDRKAILLDEPIKSLGEFSVKIRVHAGMTAEIKVLVIPDRT